MTSVKSAIYNVEMKRGDTFYRNIQIQYKGIPVNLTAYNSAKMQVRESELNEAVLTLSSEEGTINIENLEAGQIILNAQTDSIEFANHYYYDIELRNDDNNTTHTVVTGKFILSDDYTR